MNASSNIAMMPTPDSTTTPPLDQYRTIPIREIRESKTNPRRVFNETAMADLTESVKHFGILEPILVRPLPQEKASGSRFEIVAGARRYRAAKPAGLTEIPCRVLSLTDEEVLEIQVVENLQRDDLHPLEEARGYQALMAAPHRHPVDRIARKIGRSEKYVYDRVKLLELTKDAQDLFWQNEITAGHAVILARIPGDKQKLCLETALFVPERTLFDPEHGADDEDRPEPRKAITVRELQAWVDEHVRFDAKQADPMLFPDTAQTLAQAEEADEKVLPITYEHVVQDTVRDGSRIFGPRSWVRADGQYGSKVCDHSELGLVVAGPRRGEAFRVCRDKQKCLVHYGKDIRARQKADQAKADGKPSERDKLAEQQRRRQEREAAERAAEEAKRAQWKKAAPAILKAVAERVKAMPTKASGTLAQTVLTEIKQRTWMNKRSNLVPAGTTAEDVVRHAAFLILEEEISNEWHGRVEFTKRAKSLGIDLDTILEAHGPAPAQTSAASAAKPAKKGPAR